MIGLGHAWPRARLSLEAYVLNRWHDMAYSCLYETGSFMTQQAPDQAPLFAPGVVLWSSTESPMAELPVLLEAHHRPLRTASGEW